MKKVHVTASGEYDVIIGKGILSACGNLISEIFPKGKTVIVSDDKVYALYGETVEKSLQENGFSVEHFTFPNGEKSKTVSTYTQILEFFAKAGLTRSDFVVALGGGVTGDMAGFAAATYLRGIKFVQIPTTFLSAIDSSVGGKTGVNLDAGKNLVGGFSLIDVEVLRDDNGKPYINLYGNAKEICKKAGVGEVFVTLSHSNELAMAYVVLEKE